ncbi:SDR family NAD(P)-dependent oxidoreductase, partial [Rhizobiaceae sp. 2RAB30]
PAAVAAAAETLRAKGLTVFEAVFDVTDPEATGTAIDHIEREVGALDILINNAGMQFRAPLEAYPVETWKQMLETNISSAFYVAQAAALFMI